MYLIWDCERRIADALNDKRSIKKSETKRTKGKAKGKRRLAHEQLHTLQFTLSNLEATTTISNRNIKD